jgi:hypothetical protein
MELSGGSVLNRASPCQAKAVTVEQHWARELC